MPPAADPWVYYLDGLRRRDSPTVNPGDTVDGTIGSWIQQTLDQDP